jgi:UDP-2,3-diacylglucosamine hydrolase
MPKPEFITSDTHLGAVPAATERAFLQFLEHVGTRGSRLIMVGDLFDFWFEYGEIIHGPSLPRAGRPGGARGCGDGGHPDGRQP